MKKILYLCLLLTACANDSYKIIPHTQGSQSKMSSDLYDCKMQVHHEYHDQKSTLSDLPLGLISVGISEADDSPIKLGDLNKMVEQCMLKKGYSGTSEN